MKHYIKYLLENYGLFISRTPSYTSALRDFLFANEINVVLDVGAFRGAFCDILRNLNYQGTIVSFEPSRKSFEALSASKKGDLAWRGFNYGLSDTDKTAVLNTFGRGEFNSLLNLRESGISAYHLDPGVTPETIELRRLDSVWDEIMPDNVDPRVFLKLDTQGHDIAVTNGAIEHLHLVQGIQAELPSVEIYDGMISLPTALQQYADIGFVPFGFFPVNVVESYGSPFEFDVLLRRPPLDMRARIKSG